jgi:hypothetical protein
MSKEIDELKAEIAQLRAEVERAKPPAPPHFEAGPSRPTTTDLAMSRVSMSREVMREMANAVPDGLVRQIVNGSAPANLTPLSEANARPRVADDNRSGWREPRPLGPPEGIAHIDRLVEVQTARDTAELIEKEARRLAKK